MAGGTVMTEERLRRWVNGELSPVERRKTTRWIVQCTDPDLGTLLDGLIRERREAPLDAALAARGPVWRRLVRVWSDLVDGGAAGWIGPGAPVALASADGDPTWIVLNVGADEIEFTIRAETGHQVAAYLSTDDPNVVRLLAPGVASTVRWPQSATVPTGSRPTLWALRGAVIPRRSDAEEELLVALQEPALQALSYRWDPQDF